MAKGDSIEVLGQCLIAAIVSLNLERFFQVKQPFYIVVYKITDGGRQKVRVYILI
jgi:hypothetical protein